MEMGDRDLKLNFFKSIEQHIISIDSLPTCLHHHWTASPSPRAALLFWAAPPPPISISRSPSLILFFSSIFIISNTFLGFVGFPFPPLASRVGLGN